MSTRKGINSRFRPPRTCFTCGVNAAAWTWPAVDYCYDCLPGGPFRAPPCERCGSDAYYSQGLCDRCHPGSPEFVGSCKDCLAWGVYRRHNWKCWNAAGGLSITRSATASTVTAASPSATRAPAASAWRTPAASTYPASPSTSRKAPGWACSSSSRTWPRDVSRDRSDSPCGRPASFSRSRPRKSPIGSSPPSSTSPPIRTCSVSSPPLRPATGLGEPMASCSSTPNASAGPSARPTRFAAR